MNPEEQDRPPIQYLVWEVDEVTSVCSPEELAGLNNIMARIAAKRKADNLPINGGYIVVPTNKTYAPEIDAIVRHNEGGNT